MAFPMTVAVKKSGDAKDKVTTLIRTLPMTFQDTNRNYEADADEAKNVYDIATAVERDVEVGGQKQQARAIVVGSVGWMADVAMRPANAQFGYDAIRWLSRDEDVAGEIESEEDVAVVHTREEDWYWFLTAMFAMPSLVIAATRKKYRDPFVSPVTTARGVVDTPSANVCHADPTVSTRYWTR